MSFISLHNSFRSLLHCLIINVSWSVAKENKQTNKEKQKQNGIKTRGAKSKL